jgi:CheY-like chemotaxis protein
MAQTGRKILVVDDDPWIAKMLEFVATDAGHTAVVCKDGVDTLEKFAEVMPDLVLLDVGLPRLDGLKVCESIKKTPIGRLTPVLVFSGIYRDSTEAMKFGADFFLAKPFTPQQIGLHMKQMLPLLPEAPPADLAAPPLKPGTGETSLLAEPLPRCLGRLHRRGLTGVLTLRARAGIKYLFVERGNVVQVRSASTATGVTTALLARGRVSAQQLEQLEKTARASQGKKLLSQLLVEAGLVKQDELRKLILGQMLWEIFEVFRWREGLHAFNESPPLPTSAGQFKLDLLTPNLVHWGVRRMDPKPPDLDPLAGSRMAFLQRADGADAILRPLQLTERERSVLALIDRRQGNKSLQEILSIADLAGYDATPTLYTLLCLGALETAAPAAFAGPTDGSHAGEVRALAAPFAHALMELWRGRETGVLRCVSALDNRCVYVGNGRPIFARSERNSDRLDQMLVRAGTITPEQAQKSLELQQRTPNRRIGQILVEMGALRLEELHAAVKQQVQNLVLSLFTWVEGSYQFEPGPLPTQEAITLDWDTPGAVLQGLRGLPLNYIRPLAPSRDAVIERTDDRGLLRELQLNSAEQKLLALLVGRHPMEQLLQLDFIANETLIRGVVTFAALGLVVVKREPGAGHAPAQPIQIEHEAGDGPGAFDPNASPGPNAVSARAALLDGQRFADPVPADEAPRTTEPGEPWTAIQPSDAQRRGPRFAGPALAAFDAGPMQAPADSVQREHYDALLAEKQELQQRLWTLLEERRDGAMVPREEDRSNVRPFRGTRKVDS